MATTTDLGKLRLSMELGTAELTKSINESKSLFERFTSGIVGSSFKFNQVTQAIGGITTAVKAMAVESIGAAIDFNAGMADIATLIPGNRARVEELGAAIRQLSVDSGGSVADLTEGMYQVISAFGESKDSVNQFKAVVEASVAGNSTTKQSLELLAAAAKAYGDNSAGALSKVSDLALQAVKLGQTTFPELSTAIQNVASSAVRAGVSQDELFAAFSSTTGVIGNASVVSTKLRAALDALLSPSAGLKDLLKEIGVSSGEALIQQQGLQGAFKTIVEAAERTHTPLQELISSTEGQGFAASIAGAQSKKFSDDLKEMKDSVGATDDAVREQTEGVNKFGFEWKQLTAAIDGAKIALGELLIKIAELTKIDSAIRGVTSVFQTLSKTMLLLSGDSGTAKQVMLMNLGTSAKDAQLRIGELRQEILKYQQDLEILKEPTIRLGIENFYNTDNSKEARGKLEELNAELKKQQGILTAANLSMAALGKSTEETSGKAGGLTEATDKQNKSTGTSTSLTKDQMKALDRLKQSYSDTLADIKSASIQDELNKSIQSGKWDAVDTLADQLKKSTADGIISGLDEGIRNTAVARDLAEKIADSRISREVEEQLKSAEDEAFNYLRSELPKAFEDSEKEIEDSFKAAFDAIKSGLPEAAEKAAKETKENQAFLSDMKDVGLSAGANILQGIADALNSSGDGGDVSKALERAIGQGIEDGLAAAANSYAPGSGAFVKPLIEIGEYINKNIFRGTDAGSDARSAFESYLEDLLGRNVQFGGMIKEGWGETFAQITGDGQGAFEALGEAIASMTGQSIEYAGQLGYIIAADVGGSIDEARMLVQLLGLDSETLVSQFEAMGNSSELSWRQVSDAIRETNQLTAEGLVGVGDIKGAYDQIVASAGRGQQSIISLRNFSIEAGEASVQGVNDLRTAMGNLGLSQQQIDQMIGSLATNGITTIEQLRAADDRTLQEVIASLDRAGIEWGDYATSIQGAVDKVDDLNEKLKNLSDQTVDVTVKVRYENANDPPVLVESKLGNIFDSIQPFAKGGLITKPTFFRYGGITNIGVAGEAGTEAILPLGRNSKGELGAKLIGGLGGGVTFNYTIHAPNAAPGMESVIADTIRKTHDSAVRTSVNVIRDMIRRGA